jgi:hypothetical protein
MILQVVKLLGVSGSGSLLTQLSGWAYFISWATIEVLMKSIAQRPLKTAQHIRAISLCQQCMNLLKRSNEQLVLADRNTSAKTTLLSLGIRGCWSLSSQSFWHSTTRASPSTSFSRYFSVSDSSYLATPDGFFSSAGFLIKMHMNFSFT